MATGPGKQLVDISVQPCSTTPRSKVNVSHFRRENEFLRVIEVLGGIANLYSKEFLDAHMALISEMAHASEPTSSSVGARLDKRTVTATIDNMESRGRIKKLKTSVVTPTGANRPACVVYLPDVDDERLYAFLGNLGRTLQTVPTPIKRIDEAVEYGANRERDQRRSLKAESEDPKGQRLKPKHRTKEEKAKAAAEAKALLRKKATETRSQREKDWDDLLNRVHPNPLKGSAAVRVRRVRHRFMQSGAGKDVSKWEKEVNDAVREADIAANKVLKKRSPVLKPAMSRHPPPITTNPPDKSIESLIALQRPTSTSRANSKGKGKQRERDLGATEGQ
jgi:hypothetical protein